MNCDAALSNWNEDCSRRFMLVALCLSCIFICICISQHFATDCTSAGLENTITCVCSKALMQCVQQPFSTMRGAASPAATVAAAITSDMAVTVQGVCLSSTKGNLAADNTPCGMFAALGCAV